ncbi:MAG: methyltransferase domain-containing protein [Steroidobacteraceae bacterium]
MSDDAAFAAWAESLAPVSAAMLEAARLRAGDRVLDLGAGAGLFASEIAARVGDAGAVVAVDPSPSAIAAIGGRPAVPGSAPVRAVLATGETLRLDEAVDVVVARNSVMYIADLDRALGNVRSVLRVGGRFVASVYASLEQEPFHAIPLAAVRRRTPLSPPLPEYAAAFTVTADDVVAALVRGGFGEVRAVEVAVRRSYPSMASLESSLRSSRSLAELIARLPDAARPTAWTETLDAFARYAGDDGSVVVPGCQVVIEALA